MELDALAEFLELGGLGEGAEELEVDLGVAAQEFDDRGKDKREVVRLVDAHVADLAHRALFCWNQHFASEAELAGDERCGDAEGLEALAQARRRAVDEIDVAEEMADGGEA